MASESSNDNDNDNDWLGRVEQRLESEFGEGCMKERHKSYAGGYKDVTLEYHPTKTSDEIVEELVGRVKTKYKDELASSKKQKVEQRRTHFFVTVQIAENGNKIEIATTLVFKDEPDAEILWRKVRKECQHAVRLPLYYLSTSNNRYVRVPASGVLPEDMSPAADSGAVQIKIATSTPPPSPERDWKREAGGSVQQTLDIPVFSKRLQDAFASTKPPNIHFELYGERFDAIPTFFHDEIGDELRDHFEKVPSSSDDRETCVLFAVPGAGKTRTVAEIGIRTVGAKFYKRIKVNDDVLATKFRAIAQQHKEDFKQASYRKVMDDWLIPVAKDYLKEQCQGSKLKVLHFDEVQKLMGHCMISSSNYESKRGEAEFRDFFMPAFCAALDSFSGDPNNPLVVLSGTNFFSPLQFNPGSAMKVKNLHLSGRFPSRWVIDELINKYFDFSGVLENDQVLKSEFEQVIKYLSANRRAVQYFLGELRSKVIKLDTKLDAETLLKHVKDCSKTAVDKWSLYCGEYTAASCMVSLALCLHPEGFRGERGQIPNKFPKEYIKEDSEIDVVFIQHGALPPEVQLYANSGGLNIWARSDHKDAVEVPVGCLRDHLLRRCDGLSSEENSQAIQAIAKYTKTVDPKAKGHFFERGFAFELTTFGSQIGNLVCETLSNTQRKMTIDGRIFGNDWVIAASIIDTWKEGRMHCVFEDDRWKGERIVDVGFPVVNVFSVQKDVWRVYCELKNGYEPGELWKLCNKFLKDITPHLEETNSCAIFIGSRAFLQAKLQPGAETSEAKKAVTESSLYGDRFFILDGDSLKSKESHIFLTSFDRGEDMPVISTLSTSVDNGNVYVSESQ